MPHHNVICTHSHLLVAPHSTYYGPLLSQKFTNNNIAISKYYAVQQRKYYIGCSESLKTSFLNK